MVLGMKITLDSAVRLAGIALLVFGLILLSAGTVAWAQNYQTLIAVLLVFGAVFTVLGLSLILVISLEKKWE